MTARPLVLDLRPSSTRSVAELCPGRPVALMSIIVTRGAVEVSFPDGARLEVREGEARVLTAPPPDLLVIARAGAGGQVRILTAAPRAFGLPLAEPA